MKPRRRRVGVSGIADGVWVLEEDLVGEVKKDMTGRRRLDGTSMCVNKGQGRGVDEGVERHERGPSMDQR